MLQGFHKKKTQQQQQQQQQHHLFCPLRDGQAGPAVRDGRWGLAGSADVRPGAAGDMWMCITEEHVVKHIWEAIIIH